MKRELHVRFCERPEGKFLWSTLPYDLISVWNTGHPGNICTVHASSAEDALHRINRLAQQAQPGFDFMPEIERMVGGVVFVAGQGQQRTVNMLWLL